MSTRLFKQVMFALSVSFVSNFVLAESGEIARGRYLVQIGACNDCHTAGFAPSDGAVEESKWLEGDRLGYQGAWGTTYPTNLRNYMFNFTSDEWVEIAKNLRTRPPMPFWALNVMTDDDLRAMHAYITSLGKSEAAVPAYQKPGAAVPEPVIRWPMPPE